jgi:hypothetical protein
MSNPNSGHHAHHRGLQNHSVGSIYPLAVVAYDNGNELRYTIENLTDGTVCCTRDDSGGRGVVPRQWDRAILALSWLSDSRPTRGFTTVWVAARPVFDQYGFLQLPPPPAVPLTPYQEYQRALEMDVG